MMIVTKCGSIFLEGGCSHPIVWEPVSQALAVIEQRGDRRIGEEICENPQYLFSTSAPGQEFMDESNLHTPIIPVLVSGDEPGQIFSLGLYCSRRFYCLFLQCIEQFHSPFADLFILPVGLVDDDERCQQLLGMVFALEVHEMLCAATGVKIAFVPQADESDFPSSQIRFCSALREKFEHVGA